jgi:hypothetical protein
MELNISLDCLRDLEKDKLKIDAIKFQKMLLLFNAIEDGWTIKKRNHSYVFSKNHEGKKEVLDESYLQKFMRSNFDLNSIIN